MRQTRFKWAAALALIMAAPTVFWSCSSDDDEDKDPLTVNTNANKTGEHPEAGRLEIPKLKGGVANMLLVKRLSSGQVNYCIEWSLAKKSQRWSAFRWDRTNSGGYVKREDVFTEDYDIPEVYRTTSSHYSG